MSLSILYAVNGFRVSCYHCQYSGVPQISSWGVTSICALLGSSVDIPCTYCYPQDHRIKTAFWFNKQNSHNHPKDLRLDDKYKKHVEYLGNKDNVCTLRLTNIRETHSGDYAFKFTTEQGEGFSRVPGVKITVTSNSVLVNVLDYDL